MKQEKKKQKKRGGVRKRSGSNFRENIKYKALEPKANLTSRYEEIEDMRSYMDQLTEEEKDWLDRFSHEYVCGNFNHGGEILHNTDELRRDCYARNNRRNRDIHTREKAKSMLNSVEYMLSSYHTRNTLNEALKENIFKRIKRRKSDILRELKEKEERELRGEDVDVWD